MQLYTVWLEAAARPLCIQLHCTREVLFYGLSVCPSARLRAKLFGGTKQYIDWQTAESWRSRTDHQMLFSLERELFFGCTEWGWGWGWGLGLGLGLTEWRSQRSRDCSTLRLRPGAAGRGAAAKHIRQLVV